MKKSILFLLSGIVALGASGAQAQSTTGVAGNQTLVPNVPGTNTFGGLLGRTGNNPDRNNTNPGEADGNPTSVPVGSANTVRGNFNPLGAFGTQFAPQLPNGNRTNGNGMTANDVMRMRMLQSMGRNRGPQYGPGYSGANNNNNMGGPMNQMAPPNNQAMPLFNAQAEKEAEKAKARQRAEDIRAKDAETRERRKAKLLEAKQKAADDKSAAEEAKASDEAKAAEEAKAEDGKAAAE